MEREKSFEQITQTGREISNRWKIMAEKYNLAINTWGLPALSGYTFESPDVLAYKTLVTQEMLKKGYLAANSVYVCTEHKQDVVNGYFEALDPVFSVIKECEDGRDINSLLETPLCHSGFKRLN